MTSRDLPTRDEPRNDAGHFSSNYRQWIADARAGCPQAQAELLEACRRYLLMIANKEIDPNLRGKLGASDIVQDALLTAQAGLPDFKGTSAGELRLWVRQILLNKLANSWRYYGQTAKRDIHRELPLSELAIQSECSGLSDPHPTPRQEALAREQALAVEQVLNRLPPRCQMLIRLRCFERRSFVEIGEGLDLSADAARKAWCRAIDAFRREWQAAAEPDDPRDRRRA